MIANYKDAYLAAASTTPELDMSKDDKPIQWMIDIDALNNALRPDGPDKEGR